MDRDHILLTPGPLTTTLRTKLAMLRDWGSWDADFNAVTAQVRKSLLKVIHGEDSLTSTPEELDAQMKHAPAGTPLIVIPDAGHHLMFDQPLAVAAAMQAIIAAWLQGGACQAQGSR